MFLNSWRFPSQIAKCTVFLYLKTSLKNCITLLENRPIHNAHVCDSRIRNHEKVKINHIVLKGHLLYHEEVG